jgi:hypothetical protein
MAEADVFCVMNPENSQAGYCSVLGSSGGMFGLDVALGTEGLETLLDLLEAPPDTPSDDFLLSWKSLRCSFENKRALTKEDRALYGALKIKYSGHRIWPLFRSFEPGYYPWHLSDAEAGYLALCLEQAAQVCARFRSDPSGLVLQKDFSQFFCRVPEKTTDGGLKWRDGWISPDPLPEPEEPPLKLDESRIRRIAFMPSMESEWETDFFSLPDPLTDKAGGRPYYPNLLIVADGKSGACVGQEMMPARLFEQPLAERLLSLMEAAEGRPRLLRLHADADWSFLEPLFQKLGIPIDRLDFLPAVEEIYGFLEDNLDNLYYP